MPCKKPSCVKARRLSLALSKATRSINDKHQRIVDTAQRLLGEIDKLISEQLVDCTEDAMAAADELSDAEYDDESDTTIDLTGENDCVVAVDPGDEQDPEGIAEAHQAQAEFSQPID